VSAHSNESGISINGGKKMAISKKDVKAAWRQAKNQRKTSGGVASWRKHQ
jgi:hypothetical protein